MLRNDADDDDSGREEDEGGSSVPRHTRSLARATKRRFGSFASSLMQYGIAGVEVYGGAEKAINKLMEQLKLQMEKSEGARAPAVLLDIIFRLSNASGQDATTTTAGGTNSSEPEADAMPATDGCIKAM